MNTETIVSIVLLAGTILWPVGLVWCLIGYARADERLRDHYRQ